MKQLNLLIPPKTSFDSKISEILNRVEYRHLKNGIRDWIEKLKEALAHSLEKVFSRVNFNPDSKVADNVAAVFIIIGLVVILAIIILIAVRIGKTFERKKGIRTILGERITDMTTPDSLRRKASGFLADGDIRQAIRYDFIALLLLMHDKKLIYIDETKTNQEIYNHLKKNGFKPLRAFENIAGTFNSAWYGHKSSDQAAYEAWENNMKLLWNEVMNHEAKN